MGTKIIITLAITTTLVFAFVIHYWLHKLIKFKIDESSITQYLSSTQTPTDINLIATKCHLTAERTLDVCQKSHLFSPIDQDLWVLKPQTPPNID